jgi:hypothetical protein
MTTPKLFDTDCKAYQTYINNVRYCQKWHSEDAERISEAERRLSDFRAGFVDFHGDRAQEWLDAREQEES